MTEAKNRETADILILSNGPGELTTWVRPVVKALRQQLGKRDEVRISLVLSPCPNASGREVAIAQRYREIDRIQAAEHFFPFLLWGKTTENWDWRDHGVVVFLGGDQFFPVVIGKRLGYRTVIYGEWDTRWHRWIDRFGVMKPELIDRASPQYADKFTVVGDLMADTATVRNLPLPESILSQAPNPLSALKVDSSDASSTNNQLLKHSPETELIGMLPGSKAAKLAQGVPLALAIARHLHAARPQTRFVIPVAPTLELQTLARFADPQQNPVIHQLGNVSAELITSQGQPFLKTSDGLRIELYTDSPAYDLLTQCRLCLTTVGANTAELGSLAVPMIVLLPTQQLDAMRAWDGLPGLLANLPGVGSAFAKLINWLFLRKSRLLAWPNIWAGEAIVPELVGQLQPQQIADLALDLLTHPKKLEQMRDRLRQSRGTSGAASKLAALVIEELNQD
ncbi:lipid-A-disaccharide synthase [Oculatella sp. FACHB-28]|uniref:lipid-A-disaccharide synthase n=1 Tax=Oculatella sp. FACHB-28 TaxID=2692845 RepID=UPI001686FC2F|nr:lipid-A-disaccharide synthase [Oculatella sp. FACHB-28]